LKSENIWQRNNRCKEDLNEKFEAERYKTTNKISQQMDQEQNGEDRKNNEDF
jgi:hypothetical protein